MPILLAILLGAAAAPAQPGKDDELSILRGLAARTDAAEFPMCVPAYLRPADAGTAALQFVTKINYVLSAGTHTTPATPAFGRLARKHMRTVAKPSSESLPLAAVDLEGAGVKARAATAQECASARSMLVAYRPRADRRAGFVQYLRKYPACGLRMGSDAFVRSESGWAYAATGMVVHAYADMCGEREKISSLGDAPFLLLER